jgi:hypothetical protein
MSLESQGKELIILKLKTWFADLFTMMKIKDDEDKEEVKKQWIKVKFIK